MKLAGDVVGTPAWQRDRAYETDTPEVLEKQFAAEDFPVSRVESQFSEAQFHIGQAVRHLIRAADEADPYGLAQPIDDLVNELDDVFWCRMNSVLKKLKEGA